MTWLALPILAAFLLYYTNIVRKIGAVTPDSLFVYLQLIMALGSLTLLDPNRPADRLYGYILAYTIIAYMISSAIVHSSTSSGIEEVEHPPIDTFRPGIHTWALIILSILVIGLYFRAVGHVALFDGIANAQSGAGNDVASLRLDSYSGSKYFFPGYVNQFKNALLPALSTLVVLAWVRSGRRPWIPILGLATISILGLLGTAQRGAFVLFVVTLTTFIYMLNRRAFPRRALLIVALAIPFILTSTLALGRSSAQITTDSSPVHRATVAMSEFQSRILNNNQASGVEGFRYIYEDTTVQDGREWLQAFVGLLPGNRGSNLPNRIYQKVFGTLRGTDPESIWGSIYHNFGLGGIAAAPPILAILIGKITRFTRRPKRRNSLEVMGMAGVTTTIGFWVASNPVAMINNCLGIYVLMWIVGARMTPKDRANPHGGTSSSTEPAQASNT